VNRKFLAGHKELVKKLLAAHVAITQRINADKESAAKLLNEQLRQETGKALQADVLNRALDRVELTWDPIAPSLRKVAATAHEIRFLREAPRLEGIYSLGLLNEVLREKNLPEVSDHEP
jgi:NitT/TauT family transport system substrate-binding protein